MNKIRNVNTKKLDPNAILPTRGSKYAAGWDLYACIPDGSVVIPPHQTVKISTGLALEIPEGYWGGIYARSGLATKNGLRPANCCGILDSDYRGPVIVALHNDSGTPRMICSGDRIAQLVFHSVVDFTFTEDENLSETDRGTGGFGSTGDR